ncbi:MAG: AAA family ATPase [Chromatiales bacterium]|jgi:hypothetical protein|nr:AAA family ATPase [Chromatiales bacterium]
MGQALRAFGVEAEIDEASRFVAKAGSNVTEFVGRDEEVELFKRRWQKMRNHQGQVVLVSGEPGLGKSRLANQFLSTVPKSDRRLVMLQCAPHLGNSVLHPVVSELRATSSAVEHDAPLPAIERLKKWLESRHILRPDTLYALADIAHIHTAFLLPDHALALKELEHVKRSTSELGARTFRLWAELTEHWALSQSGEARHSGPLRTAIDALLASGSEVRSPAHWCALVDCLLVEGDAESAAAVATEALEIAERTGQLCYLPFTHLHLGQALLGARPKSVKGGRIPPQTCMRNRCFLESAP